MKTSPGIENKGYAGLSHSLIRHYEIFIEYGLSIDGIDGEYFKDLIRLDYASQASLPDIQRE